MTNLREVSAVRAQKIIAAMGALEPLAAAQALQRALTEVMADLGEQERYEVIMGLAGEAGEDKVTSLVHL